MRCRSSIGFLFALALLVAVFPPLALNAEYRAPDFTRPVFDMSGVILGEEARKSTVAALAALAANFRDDASVSDEVREMALAVGLRIDPANRAAHATHRQLVANALPAGISGFGTTEAVARRLWKTSESLDDADTGDDERTLRCYLLDIARRIDPDNATGHALFQKAAARGPFPGWNGILGREAEDTFVFPEEGNSLPPVAPDKTGETIPPAVATGGTLESQSAAIRFPMLARREAGGSGSRFAGLTLGVEPIPLEPGQPVRVLFPSSVEGEIHRLSSSGDTLVAALRGIHPDWPRDGSKVIARFDMPYTASDGRAGELPVALALHALKTGKSIPTGIAAMGAVEIDGTIAPIEDFLPRLTGLVDTNCDTVIVPALNETALLDLLVAGDIRPLLRYQVFTAVTLNDATLLIDEPFPAALKKARLDFDEVRDVAMKTSTPEDLVRTEAVRERLREILKLAPGHASAQFLLRYSLGETPAKLSLAGSRFEISILLAAYRPFMDAQGDVLVTGDAEQLRARTTTALTTVRDKLDPGAIPLADALGDFASAFEEYGKVKFKGSQQGRALKDELTRQWDEMRTMAAGTAAQDEASPAAPAKEAGTETPALDFGLGNDTDLR